MTQNTNLQVILTVVCALLLHQLVGWGWTLLAGIMVGVWRGRQGWLLGAAGVGSSWLLLILFNVITAPEPVMRMAETVGGILGNMPGIAVHAATVVVGVMIGTVGGGLGTQVGFLWRRSNRATGS